MQDANQVGSFDVLKSSDLHITQHTHMRRLCHDVVKYTSIHTYMLRYTHTCTHIYIHTCRHINIHANIHTYIHTYIRYTYIHTCMHTYIHTHIHAYNTFTCVYKTN